MAIRHGCTIVPVTNYGTEDMVEVIGDLPLGWVPIPFLWNSDRTLPLMRVTGDVSSFSKGKVYFKFGEPIETEEMKGREMEEKVVSEIVNQTKNAIENDLVFLKIYSERKEKEEEENRKREGRGGGGGWRGRLGNLGRMLRMRAAKETGEIVGGELEELERRAEKEEGDNVGEGTVAGKASL
uniref:Uncharacterized protein n=2 Tax=Paramoeba aestuarina TaxID=180227 RepID=A0A7S4NJ83_9EUKA|mmetsp:Transcript_16972/g.26481  ORF Transcript_16972/g.26481 Transcript_16972/m.26481 type:complete len:182 (+) Transcript_16972:625-1170(+)|eukprot:CAMPEP_0201542002 /NCGR_PEP_ID=MMETSP0161_2-20130828/71785_1 /ASSEMBLY_ACC=CAM_ASM_000251 /TAXON_ID=180227 /ORGANISM="Neoparamoeba aestuarina, Strain SoJaBio B1-5/56/2" /LENGTH=181 /DNA_ID=CAMNT_0047949587 /DNA_START=535 /DNA_END=1083 /DNA_ORIENTATION=+